MVGSSKTHRNYNKEFVIKLLSALNILLLFALPHLAERRYPCVDLVEQVCALFQGSVAQVVIVLHLGWNADSECSVPLQSRRTIYEVCLF